jgi:hypothetical protein
VLARLPFFDPDDDIGEHEATPAPSAPTTARDRLQVVADRARPITLALEQTLPLVEPLATLFPEGRLRRGITVAVRGAGATTLAFALAASASAAGSWMAMVGMPDANLATAGELGVALERVAVMLPPIDQWSATVAAVVGAFDFVMLAPSHRVPLGDARRLMARARERGTVLITVNRSARAAWPERVDLELSISTRQWDGLGCGHGHLRTRVAQVDMVGRRDLARPRHGEFALPGANGRIALAHDT